MCADGRGVRVHAPTAEDTFRVHWRGVFEIITKGRQILVHLTNSIVGSYKPRCGYLANARSQVHAWTQGTCSQHLHCRYANNIQRNAILLYDVELTNGNRLAKLSKQSICQALSDQQGDVGKKAFLMLPKTWTAVKSDGSRRRSRTR
eukprot:5597265-Pleurochrysis_carterae.AAC.2